MRGDDRYEEFAHVLRRTSFGPFPGAVERAVDRHTRVVDLIEAQLAAPPLPFVAPEKIDEALDDAPEANDYPTFQEAWIARMADDEAGIHEKMMWFWHTVFTSSVSKSHTLYCWRQLRLIHEHALGNFAELAVRMCTDGAMLQWLDGVDSIVQAPNENFAREFMELFTLGRGHYTEEDVRAAALAMAGWTVSGDVPYPVQLPSLSLREPVRFMGVTAIHTPESIVARVMEREEVAPFVVAKIVRYLLGTTVADSALAEWSSLFRSSGYEIRPVVAAMITSDEFRQARRARARHGIEWLCSVLRIADLETPPSWKVQEWAQFPYWPLNVAGWPDRWLSTSSLYARAAFLAESTIASPDFGRRRDPVAGALAHCGLYEVADTTRSALVDVWRRSDGDSRELLRAALCTPEFAVA